MKIYNSTNFFKHTFCEFHQVDNFKFPEQNTYKSKSNSAYYYTKEGVYRQSNHWGRVANCRWKLNNGACSIAYKNQNTVVGFASWSDFYPLNATDKLFYIAVNFNNSTAIIKATKQKSSTHTFTYLEATKRLKKVKHLLTTSSWANYYNTDITKLRQQLITAYISSNKTLQALKNNLL